MLVDLHDQFYQFYCADKKNRTDGRTDWQTDRRVKNIIPSATRCVEYNYLDMEIHEQAITKYIFMKDIFSFFQWLTIFAIELFNFINFWLNLLSSNSSASSTGNSGSKYLMTEENIWTDINKLNHTEFALQLGTWPYVHMGHLIHQPFSYHTGHLIHQPLLYHTGHLIHQPLLYHTGHLIHQTGHLIHQPLLYMYHKGHLILWYINFRYIKLVILVPRERSCHKKYSCEIKRF